MIIDYICIMKVILEIQENRADFFLELLKSLNYVKVLQEVKSKEKEEFILGLADAFKDVKLHNNGKKKLKTADELLNEL